MIFKALAESERHSNLLEIVQNITIDQSQEFPEKFLFYIFSKYDLYSILLEFKNKKSIPIKSMIDGHFREIAMLEYLKNGQSFIVTDEILFEPGAIKNLSDKLIKENGFNDFYHKQNPIQQNLTIPFFGELHYRGCAIPTFPYGGELSLKFIKYNKITNWTSTIKILLTYIDKSKTSLTEENLISLKEIVSSVLSIDITDETNESFIENIKEYNTLIEMIKI